MAKNWSADLFADFGGWLSCPCIGTSTAGACAVCSARASTVPVCAPSRVPWPTPGGPALPQGGDRALLVQNTKRSVQIRRLPCSLSCRVWRWSYHVTSFCCVIVVGCLGPTCTERTLMSAGIFFLPSLRFGSVSLCVTQSVSFCGSSVIGSRDCC